MAKPIIRFDKMKEADFEMKATTIVESVSDDPVLFTGFQPDVPGMQALLADYRLAVTAASNRDHQCILLRKQKRRELENALRLWALQVQRISRGDPGLIMQAGYTPGKGRQPGAATPEPSGFRISHPAVGKVKLKADPEKTARLYQFEYRLAGAPGWQQQLSSKSSLLLDGLQSGRQYEFRVKLLGTKSSGLYSDIISSYVL